MSDDLFLSRRILDTIAVLLVLAPIVNGYFMWRGLQRLRADEQRSPLLLSLFIVLLVVWLIGAFTAILSAIYLSRPPVTPTTPTGIMFGFGLLLLQAIPHFIEVQMRRIEHGPE